MDKNRIERLRYKMEKRKASICSQRAVLYTESFKESEEDSYILRKAKAFKHTLENMSIYIENEFGVRIEDMVVVTENGCEDLTESKKELIVV